MRTTIRRLAITAIAPLLVAVNSAASHANRVEYKYLYKDSTYTNTVGIAYQFCDGGYILHSGYETPYMVVAQWYPCP